MKYHLLINGCRVGPMTKEDIVQMYQQEEITPACQWKLEGEHEWEPISTFNFSTSLEHMDNPFGASALEKYLSGKYFETPAEEEFVLKSDFSFWKPPCRWFVLPSFCLSFGRERPI